MRIGNGISSRVTDEQPVEDIGGQHPIHIRVVACDAFVGNEPLVMKGALTYFQCHEIDTTLTIPMGSSDRFAECDPN